jgi:hypothetical protein
VGAAPNSRKTLTRKWTGTIRRGLLARGLDHIILRQEGTQLVAEVRGNLAGLLRLEDTGFDSVGAGSPSPALSNWPLASGTVA